MRIYICLPQSILGVGGLYIDFDIGVVIDPCLESTHEESVCHDLIEDLASHSEATLHYLWHIHEHHSASNQPWVVISDKLTCKFMFSFLGCCTVYEQTFYNLGIPCLLTS